MPDVDHKKASREFSSEEGKATHSVTKKFSWLVLGIFGWIVGNILYQHVWNSVDPYLIFGKVLLLASAVCALLFVVAPDLVLRLLRVEWKKDDEHRADNYLFILMFRASILFYSVLVFWWVFVGSHSVAGDILGVFGGIYGASFLYFPLLLVRSIRESVAGIVLFPIMVVFGAWVGLSVADSIQHRSPLPQNVDRHVQSEQRIGIALSGGGYRAALFHSGVLKTLDELGYAPDRISTVSGGSIVGAYYALNGSMCAFHEAVADGRFNLKRDIVDFRNAVRLIFPMRIPLIDTELLPFGEFNRLDVQRNLLDDLIFQGKTLNALRDQSTNLIVNATDVSYGFYLGFTPRGVLIANPITSKWFPWDSLETHHPKAESSRLKRLAQVVSLSGAFPGAFPPTRIEFHDDTPLVGATFYLADGGIIDNTGVVNLQNANRLSRMAQLGVKPNPSELPTNPLPETDRLAEWSSEVTDDMTGWAVSLIISSDGGKDFGGKEEVNTVDSVSRAISLSGVYGSSPIVRSSYDAPVVRLKPRELLDESGGYAYLDDEFMIDIARWMPEWISRARDANFRNTTYTCDDKPIKPLSSKELAKLKPAIIEDITQAYGVFEDAATLTDNYSNDDASALFRLGVYSVLRKRKQIESHLQETVASTNSTVQQ